MDINECDGDDKSQYNDTSRDEFEQNDCSSESDSSSKCEVDQKCGLFGIDWSSDDLQHGLADYAGYVRIRCNAFCELCECYFDDKCECLIHNPCYAIRREMEANEKGLEVKLNDNGKLLYECPVCQNIFQTLTNLKRHLARHLPPTYVCKECGRRLNDKYSANTHVKGHAIKKPKDLTDWRKYFFNCNFFSSIIRFVHESWSIN